MNEQKILTPLQTEEAMREARLIPFFHPLINASNGRLYGVEVLARIIDPKEGVLTPDRFIAGVEGSDLIVPFTLTLMRETMPVMTAFSAARSVVQGNIIVAFNIPLDVLSAPELLMASRYFIKNTPENIRLAFELTERARLVFTEAEYRMVSELKSAGVLLWLDDFGTGYSDFLALKSGLFDAIKIPREFISPQGDCAVTDVLRQSITATGKRLNIPVIAEGVEDVSQMETLRQEGIDFLQGYLFSPPLSAEALLIYSGKDDSVGLHLSPALP
ncbi:EAL domain-containing protein [Salmonella enterica]|uniref:EAL domain-containing protein n=1 Tax=Salmonella enterica TaxID=28901 RepID=UPI0009AE229A|nr:EAL domain-containing protein [Salmonella enterica]EBU7005294.1 EAL domain-containing protein [Salmonella enterica subsp. enterica serovar Kintambo]ECF7044175.1 EAL domain-containing protein [Salmonella enterica subsp. enterica]EBD0851654.1 EAL domain-containing protein [Salmonella enterica]EBF2435107.1 EAL domain-containing protein [Salmonella enterica]EBN7034250.1 EAL domain-containing protein [Salmonella enterica]